MNTKINSKKQTHGRAPGKTQISISLPENLVERIDKLAEEENRNRSNFIATHLERLADGEVFTTNGSK
ncbi:ribbon-helix-helix protein, CopG family [Ruficoccus amylovorans]|uniref:Ribbon-helix-helix protein, CopG family n=1 Tax=Ruficoccus amylovorans TaxID=1804625 RepID=A0A842HH86_9BACT|nr:ribbon-helix-helix domain-containing protein [Ruficoccus amylovorans]MBC2594907.1 ribbon-helix-helix protein, CopG family [Ruficoccus amylovorans]